MVLMTWIIQTHMIICWIYNCLWSLCHWYSSVFILSSTDRSLLLWMGKWNLISYYLLSLRLWIIFSHKRLLRILFIQLGYVKLILCRAHCWALIISSANILSTVSELFNVSLQVNRIVSLLFLTSLKLLTLNHLLIGVVVDILCFVEVKCCVMKFQIWKLCGVLWSDWVLVLGCWTNIVGVVCSNVAC